MSIINLKIHSLKNYLVVFNVDSQNGVSFFNPQDQKQLAFIQTYWEPMASDTARSNRFTADSMIIPTAGPTDSA